MTTPQTNFNPFGRHADTMESIRKQMENVNISLAKKETSKAKVIENVKMYEDVMKQLTAISKEAPKHSIKSIISTIANNFSIFITFADSKADDDSLQLPIRCFTNLCEKFVAILCERVEEPYDSEILGEWAPLFTAFLKSKLNVFKKCGCMLWKSTFSTIKSPIVWPDNLRQSLMKMPKKYQLFIPPTLKPNSTVFPCDDDAMDGLSTPEKNVFAHPANESNEKNSQDSDVSFSFSQQPAANEMADKILKAKKESSTKDLSSKPVTKATPTRKRAAKISLMEEDSCDYIQVQTPERKNRLTDRQKEKLQEATNAKTTVNFCEEESQSSSQRAENMKKAYTALNFVTDDSYSAPIRTIPSRVKNNGATEGSEQKKDIIGNEDLPLERIPIIVGSNVSQRRSVRSKNISQEFSVLDSPNSRSSRLILPTEPEKGLEQISSDSTGNDREEIQHDVKCVNSVKPSNNATPDKGAVVLSFDSVMPSIPGVACEAIRSPTPTPRTPSILRGSKRAGSIDSPMTERKKNRVHFGEDSLPNESLISPMTPRRQRGLERKSPARSIGILERNQENGDPSNNILESRSSSALTASAFFPTLVDCSERIEEILKSLVMGWTGRDRANKLMQEFGLKTVGDFARLSQSQIQRFGLNKSKVIGVLSQYEKAWMSKQKINEPENEPSVQVTKPIEPSSKSGDISSENAANASTVLYDSNSILTMPDVEPTDTEILKDELSHEKNMESVQTITDSLLTPRNALMPSESPSSPMLNTTPSVSPATPSEKSTGASRKNLAPIFLGKSKKQKAKVESGHRESQSSIIEDGRLLHRICQSLSKYDGDVKWPKKHSLLIQARNFFQQLIKTRGASGDWIYMDSDESNNTEDSLEKDVENIINVFRRLGFHHFSDTENSLPWNEIMDPVMRIALLLQSVPNA